MWVSTIGETIVAVAVPVAVEVLPEAAKAGEAETRTIAEARMIFFTCVLLKCGAPQRPGLGAGKSAVHRRPCWSASRYVEILGKNG